MNKRICVTELEDTMVDPGKVKKFRSFMTTFASCIANSIKTEGKRVLVCCMQGQNRSALVCVLTRAALLGETFNESTLALQDAADSARSRGEESVPSKFLCSIGGNYFSMIFQEGSSKRSQPNEFATNCNWVSTTRGNSYRLELYNSTRDQGCLCIGNWKALEEAGDEASFDLLVDLTGKTSSDADHVLNWKKDLPIQTMF